MPPSRCGLPHLCLSTTSCPSALAPFALCLSLGSPQSTAEVHIKNRISQVWTGPAMQSQRTLSRSPRRRTKGSLCVLLVDDVAVHVLCHLEAEQLARVASCCTQVRRPASPCGNLSVVEMAARLRVEQTVRWRCAEADEAGAGAAHCCVNCTGVLASFARLEGGGQTWMSLLRLLEPYCTPLEATRFQAAATALGHTGHSLLVDLWGKVWSWGSEGKDGRMGLGDLHPRHLPHRLSLPQLPTIASVACGGMARSAPRAGCRGGRLSLSESILASGSQLDFTPRGCNLAVQHAAFSAAVTKRGRLFVWGDHAHGCLGLGHVQVRGPVDVKQGVGFKQGVGWTLILAHSHGSNRSLILAHSHGSNRSLTCAA